MSKMRSRSFRSFNSNFSGSKLDQIIFGRIFGRNPPLHYCVFNTICASCSSTGFTTEVDRAYPDNGGGIIPGVTSFRNCITECKNMNTCVAVTYGSVAGICRNKPAANNGEDVSSITGRTSGRDCDIVPECPNTGKNCSLRMKTAAGWKFVFDMFFGRQLLPKPKYLNYEIIVRSRFFSCSTLNEIHEDSI